MSLLLDTDFFCFVFLVFVSFIVHVGVKFHPRASTSWRQEQKRHLGWSLSLSLVVSLVGLIVDLADDGRMGG